MSARPSDIRRIHFLPEQLANQIAAGEVVERPASVLKELLENALDAGATRIDVEVEKGGTGLIRVRDNGSGIYQEDLVMAVSRHATSKIARLEDLSRLSSLGFRGEALASIGSVSRLSLTSATAAAPNAWTVQARGRDSEPTAAPASHPVGTSVEVAELFFNTPARRKFLRSERTEFSHLEDVFKRAALSRFEVAFSLSHNRRHCYRLRAATDEAGRRQRLGQLCGKAFAELARGLESSMDGLRLHGWVAPAQSARSSTDLQHFFLNGRMVRDKLIQHAIRQAYEAYLPPGRHAAYVLYLEMPATEVDVNVHPTKHEVRFHRAREVHDFLVVAVRRALGGESAAAVEEGAAPAYAGGRPVSSPAHVELPTRPAPPVGQTTRSADLSTAGRLVARVGEGLLLVQADAGMLLLDVREADRVLVQAGLQRVLAGDGDSPALLFPVQVDLSAELWPRFEALAAVWEELGLAWDPLGEARIVLRCAPEVLHALDLAGWLRAVLQGAEPADLKDAASAVPLLADLAASHRRYRLSQDEVDKLLRALAPYLQDTSRQGRLWRLLDEASLRTLLHD